MPKAKLVCDPNGNPKWEFVRPDLQALLLEQAGKGGQIDPNRLGNWLRSLKKQRHDDYRIMPVATTAGHGNRWKLCASSEETAPLGEPAPEPPM